MDFNGIMYGKFIDYKSDASSDRLPLPLDKHRHTLRGHANQYVRHNDNKLSYNKGEADPYETDRCLQA